MYSFDQHGLQNSGGLACVGRVSKSRGDFQNPGAMTFPWSSQQTQQQPLNIKQPSSSSLRISRPHSRPKMDRHKLTLSSFAALLSRAQTNGVQHPLSSSAQNSSLSRFLTSRVHFDSVNPQAQHTISIPGLSLHNHAGSTNVPSITLQDAAALNLAIPMRLGRDAIESAPSSLLKNLTASFMSLIDSRLRISLLALLTQTKGGSHLPPEAKVMKELLWKKKPIEITTIVTSFRVLDDKNGHDDTQASNNTRMLPLVFEAVVDAKVLEHMVTVPLHIPGTIAGNFDPVDGLLDRVEVTFDTITLLQEMMKQARIVVKNATQRAATIARTFSAVKKGSFSARPSLQSLSPTGPQTHSSAMSSLAALASCSSMGNLDINVCDIPRNNQSFTTFGDLQQHHQRKQQQQQLFHKSLPSFHQDQQVNCVQSSTAPLLSLLNAGRIKIDENSPNLSIQQLFHMSDMLVGKEKPNIFNVNSNDQAAEEVEEKVCTQKSLETQSPNHGNGTKIELFSWLKGDDMLLKEEDEVTQQGNQHHTESSKGINNENSHNSGHSIANQEWVPTAYGGVNGVFPDTDNDDNENHNSHEEDHETNEKKESKDKNDNSGERDDIGMASDGETLKETLPEQQDQQLHRKRDKQEQGEGGNGTLEEGSEDRHSSPPRPRNDRPMKKRRVSFQHFDDDVHAD